jgi:phosphatidylserine/phosphatidylglycerophosphate/cardiolipin synthase-like enzyme
MLELIPEAQRHEIAGVELNLYTGEDFFRSLSHDIADTEAGDRIAITTMDFDAGDPLVAEVVSELYAAGERSVNVGLGIDAFALLNPRKTIGPIVLPFPMSKEARERRITPFEKLGELATVRCGVTNMPPEPVFNLFAGRSHIKLAIVKNKVYLGGPSMQGSDRLDMVVGFEDEQTANSLYDVAASIIDTEDTNIALGSGDASWKLDDLTRVLIDAGKPNQSHILEEAIRIIDEAEQQLIISSPFLLTGVVNDHLVKAHKQRAVNVHIAYNHVSKYEQMRLVHRVILLKQRLLNPSNFFDHQVPVSLPALHAKVLASEREGMVTSNNLVEAGVKFGTAEIALIRRDATFAQAVRALLLMQVQGYTKFELEQIA